MKKKNSKKDSPLKIALYKLGILQDKRKKNLLQRIRGKK